MLVMKPRHMVLRQVLILCTYMVHLRQLAQALCPDPFHIEAGRCIFVRTSRDYNWCAANRQCASMGGELINAYDSLKLLGSMPSLNCGCLLWLGVTDMPDERDKSQSGWQRTLDQGTMPTNASLWRIGDPNNSQQKQDCIAQYNDAHGLLSDYYCSSLAGIVCEYVPESSSKLPGISSSMWKQTPFKRTSYNLGGEYCYEDIAGVASSLQCMVAAGRSGSSRHVLFNGKLRLCRLLHFTDAQVEEEIETSPDWMKFGMI